MNKTKLVGVLLVVSAVVGIAIDALNGGGFDIQGNWARLDSALVGAGFFYLRRAVSAITGVGK